MSERRLGVLGREFGTAANVLFWTLVSQWKRLAQVLALFPSQVPVHALRRQQMMPQVLRFLLLTWETIVEFQVPGLSPILHECSVLSGLEMMKVFFLCVYVCVSDAFQMIAKVN